MQYRQLYPTTDAPPKFYGLPKIHKANRPLRPIVSSIGSITYNCAKELSKILSPMVGKTPYHITNSQDFVSKIRNERVEDDEEMRSYDVTALFTSVPVDRAVDVIKLKLEQDSSLSDRTNMTVDHITSLLKVCLETTYFTHKGIFYRQIHGAAMGSPISPIVCNLFMEDLEHRALTTAPHPPIWWYRYVDDTHTKLKKHHAQEFTDFLNSIDPDIKFTTEEEENRSLSFLDTLTSVKPDGSLKVSIYRKATHTDQYLSFLSNHPLQHKIGVIQTLYNRAETVITEDEDLKQEIEHIDSALRRCEYPPWALEKVKDLRKNPKEKDPPDKEKPKCKGRVSIQYCKGLSETLKRIFHAYGIQTFFKPTNTLRNQLVSPKDKPKKEEVMGPVYKITCEGEDRGCSETYIGETERSLKARFLEHRRPSSVSSSEVSQHIHVESPGHQVSLDNVRVLTTEPRYFERGVKEAIYIRAHQPSLNRDGGRYKLPGVYTNTIRSRVRTDM